MEKLILETQSFQLELDKETFGVTHIGVHNQEVANLYKDDPEGMTFALIRELSANLQACKELIAELDEKKDDVIDGLNDEVSRLEDMIDDLSTENDKLRSDNEVLRDELDNA